MKALALPAVKKWEAKQAQQQHRMPKGPYRRDGPKPEKCVCALPPHPTSMMLSPCLNCLFPFASVEGLLALGWALGRAFLALELTECWIIFFQTGVLFEIVLVS